MSSELFSRDDVVERGPIPLDIDNVHILLQVEQEQIQKRTFTNWVNAQLAKRRPPCMIIDLFHDFRDGYKLLDLLEVMSGQRFSRERGRGMFQHRSNIEKALCFLKKKSIKLVNINIPDIIDGKPSIILGLIWTIILQYHIEELASCLSFDSRQSSMESLASLDTRSTLSSRSASSSPVPPKGSPLHNRFRVSAKKALLLWVREQCHKAGCSINVKDFKASWRSGVVFLAILYALRPDLVDLTKARTRSNKQNLEQAFRVAEKELRIPRLLEPDDVDVRDPDEKSIMTYVAQFLQYSRDVPVPEEEMQTQYLTPPKGPSPINLPVHYTPAISASPLRQATPDRKAQEVTCWLAQAYDELLEGWDSTEGESYSERYHVFQTFLVSFNEQRRPIMPLLTAMRRTPKLSEEQRALREAWDTLSEKLRGYKIELDMSLPAPLDTVARWLLRTEGVLTEEQGDPQDHGCAADEAREKQELLRVCLEEMPQQLKTFQSFQNMDEYGNMMVPTDKMDEMKRRFTSVRVTAKYHGIKLEYREHRHAVLDLLGQIRTKLHIWKRPYISPEAVRVLLQEWHEMVNTQELPSLLEAALRKLKQISEKYSSKSALAADYHHVSQQVKQLEEDTAVVLEEVTTVKGIMGRVLSAWDSYNDCLSSLQAWLAQGSVTHSHSNRPVVTSESVAEWGARHAHLNEVGSFLIESTDPQTSRSLAEDLRKVNMHWAEFVNRNTFESISEPNADIQTTAQDLQALIREATLILKEPLDAMAGPLRTYRKRLQFIMRKIKEVDMEALDPSPQCSSDQLQKLRLATPEVMQTLFEAEQMCAEVQHSVSGLDSRLAELLHWEAEARELYQVLRATDRQGKHQGQDPRARVIISRGLQLEGQVVTEEQDLQVIIMTSQKNSPVQYLHASAMQERVRAAVAQSQEAIGMLSSLGARRDRSRSPPGAGPPSKVFIQAKAKPQHLRQSDTREPTRQPETQVSDESFLPKIIVQEYREERMTPPPVSHPVRPAVQTGTKSPPEDQTQTSPETASLKQQEIQEQVLISQQQLVHEGLTTQMTNEEDKQKSHKLEHEQPLDVQEQELKPMQPRPYQQQVEQHQVEPCQYTVQQQAVTTSQVETQVKQMSELHEQTSQQKTTLKKKPLSSQELQTRKMQAMKNRPWLQKTALREQKAPANLEQDSSQDPAQARQVQAQIKKQTVRTSQAASQQTSHPNAPAKLAKQTHQQQQEQKKEKPQPQNVQQQPKKPQQQQKTQQKETHSAVKKAQADSNTKIKSKILTETQPKTQAKGPNQSQVNTRSNLQSAVKLQVQSTPMSPSSADTQQLATTKLQTGEAESQVVHSSVKTQSLTQPQTQQYLQTQTLAPGGPQTSMQPQGLTVSQVQTWAPVRPSSPMQAPLPGHTQPPVQSHIQLRSHPQSWAPVRPPSPKPPTHGQPEAQTPAQPMDTSQIHPQSRAHHQTQSQAQISPQSMTYPQTHAQAVSQVQAPPHPKAGPQTHGQSMARPSQVQPPTHHQAQVKPALLRQDHSTTDPRTHAQPPVQQGLNVQGPMQAMAQVRASSPMSMQQLQATAQPQHYTQGIAQQGHPIPQPYPQHFAQASHSQTYATTPAFQQWTQQGPQISPHGFSHMGQSYQPTMHLQAPTQWVQTQPQIPSQSPMQQTPQIRAYSTVQTDQVQVQQQTWVQASPHLQSQPYHQPQSQQYLPVQQHPQMPHHPQPQLQAQIAPQSHPTHPIYPQAQLQTLQAQSRTHIQTQPALQAKTLQPQGNLPQPKQPQLHMQPMIQSATQPQPPPHAAFDLSALPKVELLTPPVPEHQVPKHPVVLSTTRSEAEPTLQPKVPAEIKPPTQPKDQSLTQSQAQNQVQAQSPSQPRAQTTLESKAQSPPQARPQPLPQPIPHPQPPLQPKTQQPPTAFLSQITVLPEIQPESPDLCIKPPALAQAPPQAYTEAYNKAQALARNGFEGAKYCLQAHIMEAITVFKDKRLSPEQTSVKEEILRTLDPELLEEFLRAAKGMEAFCTPSQLRDMEFFTQSVRTQWEACFSADFAEAGQHLEALRELCDTLSPEDAHRLAQTQLMECEKRLAAIQRQFSGDQDTAHTETRVQLAFSEDLSAHKEPKKPSDKPQVIAEVTAPTADERREVEKQASVEELTKKDVFERYENCKKTLQTQLTKNEQSFKDVPSDSVSLKGLHTRLQEIQFLRQESEQLWSEYSNQCSQCSQCSQMSRDISVEQERTELQEHWRSQQTNLQRRGSSLSAALRQIDFTENHMVDFTDRLDRYLRQPKDISGFTLANTNILKDIKELDDNIQSELDQLARLDPESSDLDPRERFPLTREVETHRASLDQLRQQVRKSEAAARALDRFLMSLRTVDEDVSGVQGAPCSDSVVLQECRSKLTLIRQSIDSLKEKAPQLDLLLQGARLTVTREGVPASCLDMVTTLLRRLEEADTALAGQQKGLQKDTQSKSLGLRKRTMLGELRKLQDTIEKQGLKEPTMPAVQHRLRALSDLEGQLQAQHFELESLRELQEQQGGGEHVLQELEDQWKETERAFSVRKKQCNVLLELLKKFQSCRSHLSNSIQKAEQTVSDQASYMGKDNLQRSMTKVCDIKEELGGLGEQIEEMRAVCKQLQSELKKFPDCSETPFEAEADTLMDNWLDVTEKTDAYMDNLRVGLELWEKQLMLGGEVDSWAGAKLSLFAESHPFSNEQQVLAMRDEIHANEENITHFHKKSVEIQEMLQSREAPLELQVMETQLRKRMEQVKELFTDCTDVFEELVAVRKHLSEKIEECQTAVENIQCCLSKIDASEAKLEVQIQDLSDDLESQEEQAEAVLKEVTLVSSVASPRVLEELSVDCSRLREAVSRTKDMIHLKREERDKGLLKVINDEKQSFEDWFQDLQLLVNECFENPESRADVETSVQRLNGFLKAKDTERRLDQLKEQLERGSQQFPPKQLSELSTWLREQQEEVATFRAHCQNRQKQMESLLHDLNCLQKQHDGMCEWLQSKEKQSVVSENVTLLLKDLQQESSRAETLGELLASVRRQGVRADTLLKDGDNLIQRYRNLEVKLQKQAEAQSALEGELHRFKTQVESTRTWIQDLSGPLRSPGRDVKMEEMKSKAMAILNSKPEGDTRVNDLRRQMESLCEQEDLEESRKQEVQLLVRDAETAWRTALQTAEEALNTAETQALLDKDLGAFRSHNESFQSWIKDQNENLTSLLGHMQVEEKTQIAQAVLSSRFHGESRLQDLRQQCQSLCDNQGLDPGRRQEIQDAVKHTEEQWCKVLQAAEEALNQAEKEAASERDFDAFKNQNEAIQTWIKEQKQKLSVLGSHVQFEERLQIAQAVMTSEPEGESRLRDLKRRRESLREHLEESKKLEVEHLVNSTEQQWRTALQTARQVEIRSLSDDFDAQSKNAESWIRDKQQKLQSVGSHTSPEERSQAAQTILNSRPEGDVNVNNLRRRGQTLCDHPDADEGRKVQVQQTVRDTEEQWRAVLQAAKQFDAAAAAQIAEETERRTLELREFDTHHQDTDRWLEDLQRRLESLGNQTTAEDRLHVAQTIMSSRPEGDSRIQKLRRQGEGLCVQDFEQHKKQVLQQNVRDTEEQWLRVLQNAKQAVGQAERQCALDGQLGDFQALGGNTTAWLEEKQKSLVSLDSQNDREQAINTAQNILSCKPEGDSKLTELRRRSQSLSDQQDLEEHIRQEAEQTVRDSEEQWKAVLQAAENTLKEAEVQYSLSRELEAFRTQAGSTKAWVEGLQRQAESMQGSTHGSKAEIEERLYTAQAILSSGSNGDAQVTELRRRAQSLCEHKDLENDKKAEVEQMVRDIETWWRTVVQAAEDTHRQLQGVVERLVSCQYKRDQAEARLAELQKQTSSLPHVFPWPGLGERRQAVEQARTLLDQSTALAPVLSEVRTQAAEMSEITEDQSWTDPSWKAKEEAIPALLRELTDVVADLERGIQTERQCTLLIEQHEAAQDWLREQVKGLQPPPADRHGLHSAANNLKALLQTVDREQREMTELDSARDSLLSLCTPGGQDALTLEVSHLHDLCANSEQEVKERLRTCERQLEELDRELAQMAQGLKERAAALQWELRSLDQALTYSEPQNNIAQLQQHWNSLQNCEKSLEGLGVKVQDLHQEVKSTSSTKELPAEIISVVESLCQQHSSLKSRLCEHQGSCSTNTATYLQDCLHALQQWSQHNPSDSVSSVQAALEEEEKLQSSLQEALSHQQFLADCLTSDLFEKLQNESSERLGEVDTHKASLRQSLKVLKTSLVAPPRKSKRSVEKQTISLTEKSASTDDLLTPAEAKTPGGTEALEVTNSVIMQQIMTETSYSISQEIESKRVKPDEPTAVQKAPDRSETFPLPSRRKSKTSAAETEIPTSLPAPAGGASDVFREPEPVPRQSDTAEVLPPRRKSKSPKLPPKHTEPLVEEAQSQKQETKVVPVRRKSKNAEPTKQDSSQSPEEAPGDKKIPDSLTSTAMETETAETAAMKENKPSPTKRKSKGEKLVPELSAAPGTQEPSVSSAEQTQLAKTIPARRKSKGPEVAVETKQESFPQIVSEPAESPLVPPKRKSKSTELSLSLAEDEGHKSSSDFDVQVKLSASEETNIFPARRRPKTTELPQTSESADVLVAAPDAELEQNKKMAASPAASPELPHREETQATEKPETQTAGDAAMEDSQGPEGPEGPEGPNEDADSGKPAPALAVDPGLADRPAEGGQRTVADISSAAYETERHLGGTASVQDLEEKKVTTVILDADDVFVQTAETRPYEAELSHPEPVKSGALPDTITPSEASDTELEETQRRPEGASEQMVVLSTRTQPPLSSGTSATANIADYIDKLWENTDETQKRYLILELPDAGVIPTCEIKQDKDEESETVSPLKLSEQPEEGDDDIQLSRSIQASPESQDDVQEEPEVRILQLDVCTSLEENGNTCVSVEAVIHSEGVLESRAEFHERTLADSSVSPPKQPQHKTDVVEISFYEQDVARRTEAQPEAASEHEEEASVSVETIHMGPEVRVLQLDIQTSSEEHEEPDVGREVEPVVPGETKTEKVEVTIRGDGTEYQDYLAQMDSAQLTSIQPHEIRYIEITLDEPDGRSLTDAEMSAEERPGTDRGIKDERPGESTPAADDLSKSLGETAVGVEKIQVESFVLVSTSSQRRETAPADLQPEKAADEKTGEEEQEMTPERQEDEAQSDATPNVAERESQVQLDAGKEIKDEAEVQPDGSESEMSKEGGESFAESPSEPTELPKVATDEHKTQEKVPNADEVEKSSVDVVQGEVTQQDGLSTQENGAEGNVLSAEKLSVEPPEESAMENIFTEIQQLAGTGAISQLIEGKPKDDAPETVVTSTSDWDIQLSRLVSKVLSCKNRPAELSPTAMVQQMEEIQECREQAQHQVSLFPQLLEADAADRDSVERLEDQWSAAAQDAAALVQSKEAQLQLVTDYCRQIQTVRTTTDRLTAELEAVKTCPQESSNKEAEQLCSLQRSMEENRTVLGEVLMTHSKLRLHLSRSDRETAQTELKSLQDDWRTLERNIESTLHRSQVHSHQTSSLLSELSGLLKHMETIGEDLEATFSSASRWNCRDEQQLMQANAEVKAAQQQVFYLQQRSEELLGSSRWEKESTEIRNGLQEIKDKLSHTEELVSSQTKTSSNPMMEKIVAVMRDGLAWAKQTERDIEGRRKRVPLLPEEVHHQLRDLKKLQSEVMSKQGQLETLVEEVTELLPQLDQAEEVPIIHTTLDRLEELSKSTTEKLSRALKEVESGLQTREKLSEQMADLDSWIVAHLQSEAGRSADSDLVSQSELDRRGRQIQETQSEAERQTAICEALLIRSKDIASELSVTESCQLFDQIRTLQEDVRAIGSSQKADKDELDELVKTVDSRFKNLATVEKSLREILVDLSRHRYPVTRESLQAYEPFKHLILEHKSQVDLLIPWIPQEKTRELNSVISELQNQILTLEMKAKDHERYLNTRQCVEDLRESVQEGVGQSKEDGRNLEDRFKLCHTLLILFPLMKGLSSEARSALQMISADLYPSQLSAEQQRLQQNEDSLDTWETTLSNNLRLIELDVLTDLDLQSEKKATQIFLLRTKHDLHKLPSLHPDQTLIDREYQRVVFLKKTVESKVRMLEVLEQKKGSEDRRGSLDLMDLKNAVLHECDLQMEKILQASECLRGYTSAVKDAVRFLQDTEVSMLPPQGSVRPCCNSLEDTQQALASLQQHLQTYLERLQNQAALQTCLSPHELEQLQENVLSRLLVRVSTLQAKGQVRLECLSRCAEQNRNYTKSHDEIILSITSAESRLLQLVSHKVTSLTECTDQEEKLRALSGEMESLLSRLEDLKEWCPEQSCRGGREAAVTAIWRRVSRLRRCTQELTTRSKQSISEWLNITNSVEKASVVLEQVEAELPGDSRLKASEELQDLLQSWEQYQDRLDCEHRSLSALELRAARLLGVPAHLEQAPPTPLCQQLQGMQGRYDSVKQRSSEGLLAARVELEEREKVREELKVVRGWLEAAQSPLSDMEKSSCTQELLEIYSQLSVHKSALHRIMEQIKMKYSDVYSLVPAEIDSQLQEVTKSMEEVELKVGAAVEKRGPVSSLGVKLSDIQAGLRSVQKTLEERSPTVTEAKTTQKHVWDQLDVWHSRLAALEVEMQDLEKPEEALMLTERLVDVQQLHSLLAKQAEQRTTLLSKIHTWLQEHQEMINSSKGWMAEAQSWLAAPCTYTTAKCLSSHVNALQLVLNDAAQIRGTLQGFGSVLKEMSQVCDITALQEQLMEADRQVAEVQDGFTAPLSQLEHAAAEVEAIESEVKRMESDVTEIKTLLSYPESLPKPKEERLKIIEQKIQPMRRTIAEIQKCKPGLCLPENAEETMTVFTVVDQLQTLLLELEKKVPALFIQQPPTPTQAKLQKSISEEAEKEEQGQIRIVRFEEDVVKRSGGSLQTVGQSSVNIQREHQGVLQAEEATHTEENEELRVEDAGASVLWWLWDAFLGASAEVPLLVISEETEAAAGRSTEEETQDVEGSTDTAEASSSEALSEPLGTVRSQALSESMVNTASTQSISKSEPRSQQRCVVS